MQLKDLLKDLRQGQSQRAVRQLDRINIPLEEQIVSYNGVQLGTPREIYHALTEVINYIEQLRKEKYA